MNNKDNQTLESISDSICRDAIDFSRTGLVRCSPDGIIQYINENAIRILDIDDISENPFYIIGKNLTELVSFTEKKRVFYDMICKYSHLHDFIYCITTRKEREKYILHDSRIITETATGEKSVFMIIRDITRHHEEKATTRKSSTSLQKYFDIVRTIIVSIGADQKVTFINKRGCELLGYRQKEIIGKNWFDNFIPENIRGEIKSVFNAVISEKKELVGYYNNPVLTKSGEERLIKWKNIALRDHNNKIIGSLSSGEDITGLEHIEDAMKKTETALQNIALGILGATSEEIYYSLVKYIANNLDADYIMMGEMVHGKVDTLSTIAVYGDGKRMDNFEYAIKGTPCEVVINHGMTYYPEKVRGQFPNAKLFQEMQIESYIGLPLIDSMGNTTGILTALSRKPIKNPQMSISIMQIFAIRASAELERKRSEDKVNKSYQSQLALNLLLQISLTDISMESLLERSLDVLLSVSWLKILSKGGIFLVEDKPDTLNLKAYRGLNEALLSTCSRIPFGMCLCGLAAQTGKVQFAKNIDKRHSIVYDNISPHGHYAVPIFSPVESDNKVIGVIILYVQENHTMDEQEISFLQAASGALANLIHRKQMEEALRHSEQRYISLIESARDIIFSLSDDGSFLSINSVFETVTGWSRKELISKTFSSVIHSEDSLNAMKVVQAALKGESTPVFEARVMSKNGEYLIVEFLITPRIEKNDVTGITGVGRDITRRKRMEEERQNLWDQLLQSQKLESVGRLAGGMAHDFNNMLTGIIGYSELALQELPKHHPIRERLEVIEDIGEKAALLIQQLLAFSRKQTLEMKVCNLNPLVENLSKLLVRIIGEDVKLKTNAAAQVSNVLADYSHIEQIIPNLAVNARDAMPKGGVLTIETADITMDEDFVKKHKGAKAGKYVLLSVKDTGIGMEPELQRKIFEPFFTTKKKGEGSGLGLSTAFGIIKQHNGYIDVESTPGKGTDFKIYLPASEKKIRKSKKSEPHEIIKREERILVVEDNSFVKELIIDTLKPVGFKILEAPDGEEALKMADATDEKIDLLLTDVVMTGISGWEVYEALKKKRPDIKVIFASGYIDNPIIENKILKKKMPFIKKPMNPNILLSKISEVLDK